MPVRTQCPLPEREPDQRPAPWGLHCPQPGAPHPSDPDRFHEAGVWTWTDAGAHTGGERM